MDLGLKWPKPGGIVLYIGLNMENVTNIKVLCFRGFKQETTIVISPNRPVHVFTNRTLGCIFSYFFFWGGGGAVAHLKKSLRAYATTTCTQCRPVHCIPKTNSLLTE